MGRRGMKTTVPQDAMKVKTYAQFGEIIHSFANGAFGLVVIVGPPGLSKSYTIKQAVKGTGAGYINGHVTPMAFYELCYEFKNRQIVLDDVNVMLQNKTTQQYIRCLTESDRIKKMRYATKSKQLEVPRHFDTTSGVCIVTNWWEDSPMFDSLESRAQFFVLDMDWAEVYRETGKWFYDQEIYDYARLKIPQMREPDMRLFKKAYERKVAGLKHSPWQAVFDKHCEENDVFDDKGKVVLDLLGNKKFTSDRKRAEKFSADGHGAIQTFYTRAKEIKTKLEEKIPKIKLNQRHPPIEVAEEDAPMDEDEDELAGVFDE